MPKEKDGPKWLVAFWHHLKVSQESDPCGCVCFGSTPLLLGWVTRDTKAPILEVRIFSTEDVVKLMQEGKPWEKYVPSEAAAIIKQSSWFQRRASPRCFFFSARARAFGPR